MMKKVLWLTVFLLAGFPFGAQTGEDSSETLFKAMREEMNRSLTDLRVEGFPRPYFINYQIRHNHHIEVSGSFGALVQSQATENRTLFAEVRVGDPGFDSSLPTSHQYVVKQLVPLDDDPGALRRALWYETDLRYKQAVMNLLKKRGRVFSGIETHDLPDFAEGNPPIQRVEEIPPIAVEIGEWEQRVRKLSAYFTRVSWLEKSRVRLMFDRSVRHYLDSENNKVRDWTQHYRILLEAWAKTDRGVPIHDVESIYFTRPEKSPSENLLFDLAQRLVQDMTVLKKARKMDPYVGPAIFSPEATAILFHEAVGHRLEGDRLRTSRDGKTFMKKVGERILPPFITVIDDPQRKTFDGKDLLGYYSVDDQGQKAERVVLVEKGVLKNFLLSRTPVRRFRKSNGHARSDGIRDPIARMSNFIVRSEKQLPADALKQRFIEEIRAQNKPYGLIIKKMISGETVTDTRDFQVFKGKPLYLYKVYPEDGREEPVRGVEFLGTPLSLINRILVTGNDMKVINGFCDAESGTVPVTTIAPSVLLSEVELQTSHELNMRQPILPPPERKGDADVHSFRAF